MKNIEYELFKTTLENSKSVKEISNKLNIGIKLTNKLIKTYDLETSHFDRNGSHKRRKYNIGTKICYNCKKEFTTKIGHKKEKIFCSNKCCALSRKIPSIVKYMDSIGYTPTTDRSKYYRKICFETFKPECQICGFNEYVEVHHIDGDRKNASKENLIPLCANHHILIHKKQSNVFVQNQVDKIMLENFPDTYNSICPQKCFYGYKGYYNNSQKGSVTRTQNSKIPPKEELEKLVWLTPSSNIAKQYNVSSNTIIKWCKKYNISKPPRGYWQKNKSTTL